MRSEEQIQDDAEEGHRAFSNGTEYEIWAARHCYECVNDDADTEKYCPILSVALLGSWPKEWTRERVEFTTIDGRPSFYEVVDTCTEFEQRPEWPGDDDPDGEPDPGPPPVCEGQLDLVDAYLDTAIGELQKGPVAA